MLTFNIKDYIHNVRIIKGINLDQFFSRFFLFVGKFVSFIIKISKFLKIIK